MSIFAKPLDQVTKEDITRLLERGEAEGRHLEYKIDIPIKENNLKISTSGAQPERDRFWLQKKQINEYGRDKLMKELAAFANSDGGILILGIEETKDAPPRAAALNPLPNVVDLEDRFRNFIIDCIEPRIPFMAVKAVATGENGEGVLLLEAGASRLGPHRVLRTLETPVRREDKCLSLSMPEIHDMVIRNMRRLDDVSTRMKEKSEAFVAELHDAMLPFCNDLALLPSPETRIQRWLDGTRQSVFGYRITLIPHQDIGIPRLETITDLIPPAQCIQYLEPSRRKPIDAGVWAEKNGRRILGGIVQMNSWEGSRIRYSIMRDGFVECTIFRWYERPYVIASIESLVSAMACIFGIYDRLRQRTGAQGVSADVGVEVLARGPVATGLGSPNSLSFYSPNTPLRERELFPVRTVGDVSDFTAVINETAGDLINATAGHSDAIPKFAFVQAQ